MVGAYLRAAREEAGMTQEDLARAAGIDRTYVSLLERDRRSPTLTTLFALCRAMNIKPSALIARMERGHVATAVRR